MGKVVGVSASLLSNLETGFSLADAVVAHRILKEFGVDLLGPLPPPPEPYTPEVCKCACCERWRDFRDNQS